MENKRECKKKRKLSRHPGVFLKRNKWWIDYREPSGRRIRKPINANKRVAMQILAKIKTEISENKYLDKRNFEKVKFSEFAETYYKLHCKNKKSKESDRCILNRLKKHFGRRYLYEITPLLIEKYKIKRAEKVKPSTVNRDLACLKHMFTKAIIWKKSENNPVKQVELFKEDNRRLRYLEKEEIPKLIESCTERLKPIVTLAIFTGMRRGEIYKLKWHDIDFRNGIIHLYDTKNHTKREVFINDTIKSVFIKVKKHPEGPYVFCHKNGKPYYNLRKSFLHALKKSGILTKSDSKSKFVFHDLRHTFASQLAMAGVDLNTIRELMGHKSIEMTKRYAHLSQDHKSRAINILTQRIGTIKTPLIDLKKTTETTVFATT